MASPRRPELIPAQRRAFMLDHIRKRGAASIQELAEAIGISLSTVRRDLEHLEERGYLERSHGGALIQAPAIDLRAGGRDHRRVRSAGKGMDRACRGCDASFRRERHFRQQFDGARGGSRERRARHCAHCGHQRSRHRPGAVCIEQIRVLCLGGPVRPGSLTVLGEPGESFLSNLRVDVAFIGTHAMSGWR